MARLAGLSFGRRFCSVAFHSGSVHFERRGLETRDVFRAIRGRRGLFFVRSGAGAASGVHSPELSGAAAAPPISHPVSVAAVGCLAVRSQVSREPGVGGSLDRRFWLPGAILFVFSVAILRWSG